MSLELATLKETHQSGEAILTPLPDTLARASEGRRSIEL
jgi:hypothetical protein